MAPYQQQTIKNIIQQFIGFDRVVKIPASAASDIERLLSYLRYESTILFHLGTVKYEFHEKRKEAILYPHYLYSQKEYNGLVSQLTATVQAIRDQICTVNSPLERELQIHDALCSKVQYADDGEESHSIVGPFLTHRGVCDGISKAAKVLLQECGIKSHVISGTAAVTVGQYEPHAWNVVRVNDKWYHLDITFDSTISGDNIRYDYFNIPTREIIADHRIDPSTIAMSIACNDDNDYYVLHHTYFDSLTALQAYVCQCIRCGKRYIQVRVAKSISEKAVRKAFSQALSSLNNSVCYEQTINSARNIYEWSVTDYRQ